MSAPAARLDEVADHVYAYVQPPGGWCVSNAGVLAGPDGVVLVDSAATETRARALHDAVAAVTAAPVTTVVNTHHHGDHLFGNAVFAPPAVVVGHELTRRYARERGFGLRQVFPAVEWGSPALAPPSVTFAERLSVHVGDLRAELIHVGPAHTPDDVVVWLPEKRVLFCGDVVLSGETPFCLMGSVAGSLEAVRRLSALHPRVVVCGHGPPCGPEVFAATTAYLLRLRALAAEGAAAGTSPLALARAAGPGEEFAGWTAPERLVANLHRAYSEARGEPPAARIPSGPVFAEMVAYNGGTPLDCHA